MENYKLPTLEEEPMPEVIVSNDELVEMKRKVVEAFYKNGVEISEIKVFTGPSVSLWEIHTVQSVQPSQICGIEDEHFFSRYTFNFRIIYPTSSKNVITLEIPNNKRQYVHMGAMMATEEFKDAKMELPVALGQNIDGSPCVIDLTKAPHMLIAGATGMGKTMIQHSIITSLLCKKTPEDLRLVLIDPKKVEFTRYKYLSSFLARPASLNENIITDVSDAITTLECLCELMDQRYDLLKQASARNIKEYNEMINASRLDASVHHHMPYIVTLIDEYGDLLMTAGKHFEMPLARIAQLSRAVGIHLVISTQRPTPSVITGIIKANFPFRIACRVMNETCSRLILDASGAEHLIGQGDMLVRYNDKINRMQGAYVNEEQDIPYICKQIMNQANDVMQYELPMTNKAEQEQPQEKEEIVKVEVKYADPLFEDVAHFVVDNQMASTSMLQRKFCIGYNRTGKLLDLLEQAKIVGSIEANFQRDVLVKDKENLSEIFTQLKRTAFERYLSASPAITSGKRFDPTLEQAARLIVQNQCGSVAFIQRSFGIGFNQAGLIMDRLEELGIVGPSIGASPREVYVHDIEELEAIIKK